jgi:hypothetical protein
MNMQHQQQYSLSQKEDLSHSTFSQADNTPQITYPMQFLLHHS